MFDISAYGSHFAAFAISHSTGTLIVDTYLNYASRTELSKYFLLVLLQITQV